MVVLRSALFLLLLVLTVIVYGAAIILAGPVLGSLGRARVARDWARLVLRLLEQVCGLGYRVVGIENLPDKPSLVFCKHQSAWETIALRALLPLEQTWVLKRELMQIPVFGWALAQFRPIAIDRSAGRRAVRQLLIEGAERLAAGYWIVVFPEGTRVAPGQRKRFGVGGAVLAERTGVAVVPIAHNAGVFWRRRALRKYPGCIQLVVGPPIHTQGATAAAINATAEAWINGTVARLPAGRESSAANDLVPN